MRAFSRYAKRGFTLVELMIVVAIIGVLAALAIFGVNRYLKSAKTSEAKNSIGRISRGAQEAFERENNTAEMVAPGSTSTASSHALCESANNVPDDNSIPASKKYIPKTDAAGDFNGGTSSAGWKCLRFQLNDGIYFAYSYQKDGTFYGQPTPTSPGFETAARGDLDGDAITSVFSLSGQVDTATGTLNRTTQVYIADEFE